MSIAGAALTNEAHGVAPGSGQLVRRGLVDPSSGKRCLFPARLILLSEVSTRVKESQLRVFVGLFVRGFFNGMIYLRTDCCERWRGNSRRLVFLFCTLNFTMRQRYVLR